MASQELVKTLDYILNRCNERDIEAVAAAVIRRRKDIALYGSAPPVPDPRHLAEELTSQLNIEGSIDDLTKGVRDFAIRLVRQEAPELTDEQVEELIHAWIPGFGKGKAGARGGKKTSGSSADQPVPRDLLASMISQFVSFSLGRMEEEDDRALRAEMGPWPDKYWKAFPQVIRLLITDFLKDRIDETEFNTRIGLALQMR